METGLLVLVVLGQIALGWLLTSGGEYAKAKGKNLADKEDVQELTRLVESVKHENALLLEQIKGHGQLRLAAAERRLQVHQDAFTLWRKLWRHVHEKDREKVIVECHEWWERNCLFLAPEASNAFSEAYFAAGNHQALLQTAAMYGQSGTDAVQKNWGVIMAAGNKILAGAALPPLGHAADGAPDAFGRAAKQVIEPA